MCHKKSSPSPQSINMPANEQDRRPAARRSRTKTRKPRFQSLRGIELSTTTADGMTDDRQHRRRQRARQLNLFPLQPDTASGPVDETKYVQNHYEENVNVSLLFNGEDTSATTLSGLLDGGDSTAAVGCSEEGSVGSRDSAPGLRDSVDYGGGNHHYRSSLLVRAAMKSGGREEEEKWVSYNEVAERKPPSDQEPDEVSSCSAADNCECAKGQEWWLWQPRGKGDRLSGALLLKLDYEEVLNSWSDKGSLFIGSDGGPILHYHHEAPQTVPELNSEYPGMDLGFHNVQSDKLGNSANLWTVPDQKGHGVDLMSEDRFRQREASVLRYKEKRQNRLFSKRIRYEVRKLNAEKRPRVKGRFVRRSGEDD